MNILALDLSTKTGWALGTPERYESGVQTFDLKRGESPGMRYVRFRRWLEEVATGVELIVYEQVVPAPAKFGGASARELAYNLAGRVQELCAVRGIEHTNVWPSSLKKWTTGKGNANKDAMKATVCQRWKPVTDDNEADAIAILHYAEAEIVGPAAIKSTPF
jgi:hypothetical protein